MPHRDMHRINPSQHNSTHSLVKLLSKVPPGDCVVLLIDLNEQLTVNIKNDPVKIQEISESDRSLKDV